MSGELPGGWSNSSLGELLEFKYGKALPEKARVAGRVDVYGSNGVVGGHEAAVTAGSTIVVGRKGSVGEIHFSPQPCWPIDTTYFVDEFGPYDPSFLFHLLKHLRLAQQESSTAIPGLSRTDVYQREVPVPPLAEQKRIVEKVDALLADVKRARDRLTKVPVILKRFRQSVLATACSGRLTADWRAEQPQQRRPYVPPRQAERRSRRGANLASADAIELDDVLPELPASWVYARLDHLAEPDTVVTYGIVLPGPEIPGGVPYVRQQDIEGGRIKVEDLRHTTPQIAAKHARSSLREGDVLLCIIRNLRVALVPPGIDGANITQGSVRIRPADSLVRAEYLAAYLESPHAQAWLKQRYFGIDMPRINVEDARALPVAVPPLAEQDVILRRLADLERFRERSESRAINACSQSSTLPQAILGRAFSGELIPTEAELARRDGRAFECASELLVRVGSTTRTRGKRSRRGRAAAASPS